MRSIELLCNQGLEWRGKSERRASSSKRYCFLDVLPALDGLVRHRDFERKLLQVLVVGHVGLDCVLDQCGALRAVLGRPLGKELVVAFGGFLLDGISIAFFSCSDVPERIEAWD